jgi:hypothetical protein
MDEAEELVSLLEDPVLIEALATRGDEGDLVCGDVDWRIVRHLIDKRSGKVKEWQGFPVPLPGQKLRLCKGHPMETAVRMWDEDMTPPSEIVCSEEDVDETVIVRNEWYSRKLGKQVMIVQKGGKILNYSYWRSPDRSMDRLNLWLSTLGASDAWDHDAERKARHKLRGMISPRQYRHYDLTGSFLETSPRSEVTYVFRRLRPTLALSARQKFGWKGEPTMRFLAALCMHPIGYYDDSWSGCMVPTDDVIAHLSHMRGDEARYWGVANQHVASAPEAGI